MTDGRLWLAAGWIAADHGIDLDVLLDPRRSSYHSTSNDTGTVTVLHVDGRRIGSAYQPTNREEPPP